MARSKAHRLVVLDMGGSAIRGAEVSYRGKSAEPTIHKIEEIPLRPGIIVDGEVQSHDALVLALRELWDKAKFSTTEVKFGVESNRVDTRTFITRALPDSELTKTLPNVVSDVFSIEKTDLSNYYYTHHTITQFEVDEVHNKDVDFDRPGERVRVAKKNILLVVTPRGIIDSYVAALQEAKLKPVDIDFTPLALIRASKNQTRRMNDAAEVSVDLGAGLVTIVIHSEKQPIYIRILRNIAGQSMTKKVASELQIESQERAEARKLKIIYSSTNDSRMQQQEQRESVFGDDEDFVTQDTTQGVKLSHDARKVVSLVIQSTSQIIEVINETLEYQKEENSRIHRYSNVTVSGGLAEVPRIISRMGSELKTPVEILNPFLSGLENGMTFDDKGSNPELPYPDSVKGREHLYSTLIGLTSKGGYNSNA